MRTRIRLTFQFSLHIGSVHVMAQRTIEIVIYLL